MSWVWLWFSFNGRATRRDFWLRFWLTWLVIWFALNMVAPDALVRLLPWEELMAHPLSMITPLSWVLIVAMNLSGIAVGVKRFHDRDRFGWFLQINYIPCVGQLWLLIELGFFEGTNGSNCFGPDPRAQRV